MGDIIHLLPDSVANQIAAGEVIQRPASVIKELVENSLDAGSTEIQVLVTDSGRTCIQVIDDGKGMTETDARLSFERHATSKIREAADLFDLHTMGFRGEALASIAAVAEVELKTRPASEELGTRILISGSQLQAQEVVSCPKGTNFSVKNLFFNVPARRKFLKSNATELSNILAEFEKIALAHPEVAFRLYSNGTEVFDLPVSSLHQRIVGIFGKKQNQQLLPVEVETSIVNIKGFVGTPDSARKRGLHQYFFTNGRYMRHPYFHHAVMDVYEQLIPTGEQVSYFIYFDVDPANIDVNIHPTKSEIKFENEQSVWQILYATVREALGKSSAIPTIDFDTADRPADMPAFGSQPSAAPPKVHYNPDYNPFDRDRQYSRPKIDSDWTKLFDGMGDTAQDVTVPAGTDTDEAVVAQQPLFPEGGGGAYERGSGLLQFKGRYILTPVKSGLMLIDQHRAHVRVLFDRFMQQIAVRQGVSQGVLFPEVVQLPPSEAAVLEGIREDLSYVGFELTPLGGGSYAVNGVPSGAEGLSPVELVRTMVSNAAERGGSVRSDVQNAIALTLANSAAIVYGQALSPEEMADLIDRLFSCQTPNYTPDGLAVLTTISEADIQKMFAR